MYNTPRHDITTDPFQIHSIEDQSDSLENMCTCI